MNGSINLGNINSKYGYTLVELIVVLALFAIILSIGIPSIKNYFNTRERIELMEFKRDIVFSRNSAIVENCKYIFYLFPKENRYLIKKIDGEDITLKDVFLSNGIVIENSNFKSSAIEFNATGSPSQGGTVRLKNKKGQRIEIRVEIATGKVNIYYNK